MWNRSLVWFRQLAEPIDGASLALFRLCLGALLFIEVCRFFGAGWISRYYIEPEFFFSYIPWIKPWGGSGMYIHMGFLGLMALAVAVGVFFRLACILLWVGFTYLFLLDKANYLNHFYLISLMTFLLALTPANAAFSVDRWLAREGRLPRGSWLGFFAGSGAHSRAELIPRWSVWILRAQVVLVYFFGGIAKLNWDWLRGEPQRSWMAARTDYPLFGPYLDQEWVVQVLTYGGIAIDLSVGFLLLCGATFWLGVGLAIAFNLANAYLFSIGIFPFVMIATLILFGSPAWPRRWFMDEPPLVAGQPPREAALPGTGRWLLVFLHAYLLAQLLIPLRHWLYPGSVHWTEEGHRFAWHMMLRDKHGFAEFYVVHPETGKRERIPAEAMLSERQLRKMQVRPDMILQFAQYVAEQYEQKWGVRPAVRVQAIASLNGRPMQQLIDPNADLAKEQLSLWPASWILPLQEGEPQISHRMDSAAQR